MDQGVKSVGRKISTGAKEKDRATPPADAHARNTDHYSYKVKVIFVYFLIIY